MIEYEELRLRLLESEKTVKNLKEALAIDTLKEEISELEKESSKPDFWDDMENSQKVMQKIGSLKAKVASYEGVKNDYDDALVMIELANEEEDADLLDDCTSSVEEIEKKLAEEKAKWSTQEPCVTAHQNIMTQCLTKEIQQSRRTAHRKQLLPSVWQAT